MAVPILRRMPLVMAVRALLVLLALFAIVPTQTGGALAIDELGVTAIDDREASTAERGDRQSPVKPAPHASFAAPDDGTVAGAVAPPRLACAFLMPRRALEAAAVRPRAQTRLDRPPKTA